MCKALPIKSALRTLHLHAITRPSALGSHQAEVNPATHQAEVLPAAQLLFPDHESIRDRLLAPKFDSIDFTCKTLRPKYPCLHDTTTVDP